MSISGTILHNKVREILPELPSGITREILSKACDDPIAQPFLRWFCTNVGRDNYLSPEDVKLEKHIKRMGEWLEGEQLDSALAEATDDCPQLARLSSIDSELCKKLSTELESEKDAHAEDKLCLETLDDSLRSLRQLGLELDEATETEESRLDKDRIRANKVYLDCTSMLEEFDHGHRQFFRDIESLLDVYADATERKSSPVVWTQVPLENYMRQMEMHNEYLGIYVKRHFGGKDVEQVNDSDYGTLIDDGKERCGDEKVHELLNCQMNVITSKMDEIVAKMKEAAGVATAAHVSDIYNNGRPMVPQSEAQIRMEIAGLTSRRDFHEENIELLREKELEEVVRQYARLVITKMLVEDGNARAERRKRRLEKLEYLRSLARERGHGYSDLLCMLMQLQLRRLKEMVEFIADGRYYLATEYGLSAARSESLRERQAEYEAILRSPPNEQNIFNKFFISLILGTDAGNLEDLSVVTRQYDELVRESDRRKKAILGVRRDTRIAKLTQLQDNIMSMYDAEMRGATNSLKAMSYELSNRLGNTTRRVEDVRAAVDEIRAKLKKSMTAKTSETLFERDRTIMWQRFLASPEELQLRYDEAKEKVESWHFPIVTDERTESASVLLPGGKKN